MSDFRVGIGYDIHRLVEGRRLFLCGVEIPFPLGLLGHSDADVAIHALIDALLGAAALGDIGQHFPDRDPKYRGICSMELLKRVVELLHSCSWEVGNVDLTIVAQQPKLAPFLPSMRKSLAAVLKVSVDQVSIKAKTSEGLGPCGRLEGMAAYAVALIYRAKE